MEGSRCKWFDDKNAARAGLVAHEATFAGRFGTRKNKVILKQKCCVTGACDGSQ